MGITRRLNDLEKHLTNAGLQDFTCPECKTHSCWKRGLRAVWDCTVCPEPQTKILMPVGNNGVTEYWVIKFQGREWRQKERPPEKPPCPTCGKGTQTFVVDLGMEREGENNAE